MHIEYDPHVAERAEERGANMEQVIETVRIGEKTLAKKGRYRFVSNFNYNNVFQGKHYAIQQIHAIAAPTQHGYYVVTVIVKYF